MQDPSRLYIVVREDLPSGLQAAQAVHAAFEFTRDHPESVAAWMKSSNYLIILSVPDEGALMDLIERAHRKGIDRTAVREPDVNDEITALALGPGEAARKLCAMLPLALREPVMT